jgi:hypothetical protein
MKQEEVRRVSEIIIITAGVERRLPNILIASCVFKMFFRLFKFLIKGALS